MTPDPCPFLYGLGTPGPKVGGCFGAGADQDPRVRHWSESASAISRYFGAIEWRLDGLRRRLRVRQVRDLDRYTIDDRVFGWVDLA